MFILLQQWIDNIAILINFWSVIVIEHLHWHTCWKIIILCSSSYSSKGRNILLEVPDKIVSSNHSSLLSFNLLVQQNTLPPFSSQRKLMQGASLIDIRLNNHIQDSNQLNLLPHLKLGKEWFKYSVLNNSTFFLSF